LTEAQSSKYTLRLTPKRMLGWGVLTLFMLGWMFVLGIWAGQTILLPSRDSRVTQPGGPAQQPPARTAAESNSASQPQPPTDR